MSSSTVGEEQTSFHHAVRIIPHGLHSFFKPVHPLSIIPKLIILLVDQNSLLIWSNKLDTAFSAASTLFAPVTTICPEPKTNRTQL